MLANLTRYIVKGVSKMLTWWFIIGVSIQVAWTITQFTVLKMVTIKETINMLKAVDHLVRFLFFVNIINFLKLTIL